MSNLPEASRLASLGNLFTSPRAFFAESRAEGPQTGLWIEVEGLLCERVCAARVRRSLASLPGVEHVEYQRGTSLFFIRGRLQGLTQREVTEAVQKAVLMRPLRLALEKSAAAGPAFVRWWSNRALCSGAAARSARSKMKA